MSASVPALTKLLSVWSRKGYAGTVEGIVRRDFCGWLVDRRCPERRVLFRVLRGGVTSRVAVADLYRADVQNAGFSADGYCGFRIPLSTITGDGAFAVALCGHQNRVVFAEDEIVCAPHAVRNGARLYQVVRKPGSITGFAVDLNDPSCRLRLQLIAQDGASSSHVACRYDSEAKAGPMHGGFNAFRIALAPAVGRLEDAETGFAILSWSR